jgi:hypothetical protein
LIYFETFGTTHRIELECLEQRDQDYDPSIHDMTTAWYNQDLRPVFFAR